MAFMYYTCTHGTTVGVRMACGRKRMPGMAPHSAPASMPPKKARNQMISGGTTEEGMLSAMNSVAAVPARNELHFV